ncbi:SDR family NAD(P)-dependent oxidoreductase [Streptomyces sp. NPDC002773]|uniref:SDR family NAD(P)-dependent oxidoreductase n=1 Tax=Streptomyces sp. NPDC002773 TaxID=3154430 RepID=UPI003319DF1A
MRRRGSERAQGPVVVVTGASSGIGRAVALAFARRGARVVLAARSAAVLGDVARQCAGAHRAAEALAVPTDVADARAVEALAAAALARHGRIDVWVSAAGVGILGGADRMPPEDVRRLFDVNVMGVVHGAGAAVPVMRRQGSGVLIDVSSVLGGVVRAPYMSAYAMSKAALVTFDDVLRQELALSGARGVHVCSVLPAGVDTPFFRHAANHSGRRVRALPPLVRPERVARAVVRASRHHRRKVTVGAFGRVLTWGYAVAPGLVRAAIGRHTAYRYLSPPGEIPVTTGILYAPSGATAAPRGGRGG